MSIDNVYSFFKYEEEPEKVESELANFIVYVLKNFLQIEPFYIVLVCMD